MNKSGSGILLAVIMVVLFILSVAINFFDVTYGIFPIIALGIALFCFFYTKKKTWALISSVFVFVLCLYDFIIKIPVIGGIIYKGMIFAIPGIMLIIMYYKTKNYAYAVFGSFMFFAGLFIVAVYFENVRFTCASAFFAIIGTSFIVSYFLSKGRCGIIYVFTTAIFMVLAIFSLLGTKAYYAYYIYPVSILVICCFTFLSKIFH